LNIAAVLPAVEGERRHFHFFLHRTAPELSGYFDCEFYKVLVLQISRKQPAVRHALIGLGSLHESLKSEGQASSTFKSSSLQHYNQAIGHLAKNVTREQQSVSVTLICCLIFIWFETMQGNNELRAQQLDSGLKILREWQRTVVTNPSSMTDPEARFIRQHLVPIFTRLDLQGVTLEAGRQPQLDLHLRLSNPRSSGIPTAFSSVEEARDWLDVVIYWMWQSVHSPAPAGPLPAPLNGQLYFDQWGAAIDAFLQGGRDITPAQIRASTILRIYKEMSVIMLASRASFAEAAYEGFSAQFMTITLLAESLLDVSEAGALDGFRFSFEMGVVAPLFYVSSKCQNQAIRTRAVQLLMRCPQKGGVWEGLGVAKMSSLGAKTSGVEVVGSNKWVGRYESAVRGEAGSSSGTWTGTFDKAFGEGSEEGSSLRPTSYVASPLS
jgi:hypothetical protein